MAFQDYQPYLGYCRVVWVGFGNFSFLVFGEPEFLVALTNTLILPWSSWSWSSRSRSPSRCCSTASPATDETVRAVVVYLPHFLGWVIIVSIFQQILGGAGLLNTSSASTICPAST